MHECFRYIIIIPLKNDIKLTYLSDRWELTLLDPMEILLIPLLFITSTLISPMNTCKPYRLWAMSVRIMTRKKSKPKSSSCHLDYLEP